MPRRKAPAQKRCSATLAEIDAASKSPNRHLGELFYFHPLVGSIPLYEPISLCFWKQPQCTYRILSHQCKRCVQKLCQQTTYKSAWPGAVSASCLHSSTHRLANNKATRPFLAGSQHTGMLPRARSERLRARIQGLLRAQPSRH